MPLSLALESNGNRLTRGLPLRACGVIIESQAVQLRIDRTGWSTHVKIIDYCVAKVLASDATFKREAEFIDACLRQPGQFDEAGRHK